MTLCPSRFFCGSTTLLTDEQGSVTDRYTYGPYGELEKHEGKTNQPFGYNGRDGVQSDPNGLYYMRARYYHPVLQRFLNRDVLRGDLIDGQTLNRYAYVNGDPIRYIDPLGLMKGTCPEGTGKGKGSDNAFYHSASPDAIKPIVENGFRTDIPNPQAAFHNNRYGRGVYLADSPSTALAERPGGIILQVEADLGKNLNIVDRGIYDYKTAQGIARGAGKHGYNSITFSSAQPGGGINTMIFDPLRTIAVGVIGP